MKAIATLSLRKAGFALYRRLNRYEFVTNYRGFSPTITTPIPTNFSQMLCKSPSSCMLSRKHHPLNYKVWFEIETFVSSIPVDVMLLEANEKSNKTRRRGCTDDILPPSVRREKLNFVRTHGKRSSFCFPPAI